MNPVTAWLLLQKHLIQKGHEPEWVEMAGSLFCMPCEFGKGKGRTQRTIGGLTFARVPGGFS